MAFDDVLARDPKSAEEFWTIIEETFEQVEGALTDYPVETREEALSGARRGSNFRDASISFIRYRGVRDELDSRDYFLELGRQFLPEVARQIKARMLTPKFAKDWGVVMMCHGFISAHILDDTDGLDRVRAGQSGNRNAQRKYVAHLLLHWMRKGLKRKEAEGRVEKHVQEILGRGFSPDGFDQRWFEPILRDRGPLAATYDQKHLPNWKLAELARQLPDDIPPLAYFPPK
jgi:hypothetical protein